MLTTTFEQLRKNAPEVEGTVVDMNDRTEWLRPAVHVHVGMYNAWACRGSFRSISEGGSGYGVFVVQRRRERGGIRKGERKADGINLLYRSEPGSGAETGSVAHGGRCCLSIEGAGESCQVGRFFDIFPFPSRFTPFFPFLSLLFRFLLLASHTTPLTLSPLISLH